MAGIKSRPMGSGWIEPESPADPKYPYNNVVQGESGHLFEIDDTPSKERIRIQHRSGTFIEMHPNGTEVHKVYGDGYEITIKDKNVLVKGHCSITIEGDSVVHVKGDKIEKVDGDYELKVKGKYTCAVSDKASFLCEKDMKIGSGLSAEDSVGLGTGALKLYSGEKLYITADVSVGGEIFGESITSNNSIDAKKGVTAGELGFVTNKGGISIGTEEEPMIAIPKFIRAPYAWFDVCGAKLFVEIVE